jgi:hypothetical protein
VAGAGGPGAPPRTLRQEATLFAYAFIASLLPDWQPPEPRPQHGNGQHAHAA